MKADAGNAEPQLDMHENIGLGPCAPKGTSGWHWRGYLPHFDAEHTCQFVTFRLADSLPREKLSELECELAREPAEQRDRTRRRRIEQWLDAGLGCCALRHPDMARVVQQTLQRFNGERYRLIAWCIMPNHVHVLVETLAPLAKIVQSWKAFTGRWAWRHAAELGLGVPGDGALDRTAFNSACRTFWMRDYWDRYIRDERHFCAVLDYIHANPVKAGLCAQPVDWQWSSAAVDGTQKRPGTRRNSIE